MTFRQFANEIAMDVFLGHDVGAPGRDAACTIVDRAENLGAGRIGIGLDAIMTGGGTAQRHLGIGGDAAIVCTVEHRLPLAVLLADFDNRAAMGGHFDIHLFLQERSLLHLAVDDLDEAGEHQVRIGIFVIDYEEAMFR